MFTQKYDTRLGIISVSILTRHERSIPTEGGRIQMVFDGVFFFFFCEPRRTDRTLLNLRRVVLMFSIRQVSVVFELILQFFLYYNGYARF